MSRICCVTGDAPDGMRLRSRRDRSRRPCVGAGSQSQISEQGAGAEHADQIKPSAFNASDNSAPASRIGSFRPR